MLVSVPVIDVGFRSRTSFFARQPKPKHSPPTPTGRT
jgi:hypothetical protein